MANNKSIQILRGSHSSISRSTDSLLYGQLLYDKTTNQLMCGNGESTQIRNTSVITTDHVVEYNSSGTTPLWELKNTGNDSNVVVSLKTKDNTEISLSSDEISCNKVVNLSNDGFTVGNNSITSSSITLNSSITSPLNLTQNINFNDGKGFKCTSATDYISISSREGHSCLLPTQSAKQDLGSSTNLFRHVYSQRLYLTDANYPILYKNSTTSKTNPLPIYVSNSKSSDSSTVLSPESGTLDKISPVSGGVYWEIPSKCINHRVLLRIQVIKNSKYYYITSVLEVPSLVSISNGSLFLGLDTDTAVYYPHIHHESSGKIRLYITQAGDPTKYFEKSSDINITYQIIC